MDAIAFLAGILVITICLTGSIIYATTLYHIRESNKQRMDEMNDQARWHLMREAMEQKMLPPGALHFPERD